jgi:MFS family permease
MLADLRAGAIRCVCLPGAGRREAAAPQPIRTIGLLGAGAAASLLSQALMFSVLPLAGRMLAPAPALVVAPFLALFVGAVVATFPASILGDAFGRRAAFALGASLGIAGGLVVACGLINAAFWPLAVGAFWIGTANGFALQYRHAAAAGGNADAARAAAIVIGAGALIGVVAPTLAGIAESRLTPFVGAGSAIVAALAHVLALAAALLLPAQQEDTSDRAAETRIAFANWLPPTVTAAAAWFAMMAAMAFAPVGLAGCGVGFTATVGVVAWHLVAMYAPALALPVSVERLGLPTVAGLGLALSAVALLAMSLWPVAAGIALALISAGAGWSLATSAAVMALHRQSPGRIAIAAHDAFMLAAGIAGAIFAGRLS